MHAAKFSRSSKSVKRPSGVTVVAILTFFGAAILAAGALSCFFIGVMGMTTGDGGEPASAAIAGMGFAGGFSLLVLASVAGCVAVNLLKLREWARIVSIAAMGAGIAFTIFSLFTVKTYLGVPVIPMTLFHLLMVALAVWMLAYLLRPVVKQAFAPAAPLAAPRTDHAATWGSGNYRPRRST